MQESETIIRRALLQAGLGVAATGLWPQAWLSAPAAAAANEAGAATIGRRELLQGLDGMSRVAERRNVFGGGHNAAAVMAAALFCREQALDEETRKEILSLVETRLLTSSIYEARPKEAAEPELIQGLLQDLDAGIGTLRQSGHNIIFANACLKALREVPEAAIS